MTRTAHVGDSAETTGTDRRNRTRVTVGVPLQLYRPSAREAGVDGETADRLLMSARTLDLSTGGALLHGACPADVGSPVRVEVSRGPVRNPLRLAGTVVRFTAPSSQQGHHGVAIRFDDVSPIDEAVLGGIIRDARL